MTGLKKRIVLILTLLMASVLFTSFFIIRDVQINSDYENKLTLFSSTSGGMAWNYLQNSTYTELLFEVDILSPYFEEGSGLKQFDNAYLSEHFEVAQDLISSECMNKTIRYVWSSSSFDYSYTPYTSYYPEYTASELMELAESYRNYSTGGHIGVIHIIFLDGRYITSSSVGAVIGGIDYAGTTVDATTVFVFLPATIENSLYGPEYPYLSRDIAHEVGHVLGLVAPFGADSPYNAPNANAHIDTESVRHCSVNSCLMSTGINKGNELCDQCKADLSYLRNSSVPYASMTNPGVDWLPIAIGSLIGTISAGALFVSMKRR